MSEEKAEYMTESTEMPSDFKREEKYLVIKIDDAREYLTPEGQDRLREIASYIENMRRLHGKRTKQFVCISDACPYYDEAWALVEKWVTGNTRPEPDAPEGVFISRECAEAAVIGIKESFGEVAELHELEQALEQSNER